MWILKLALAVLGLAALYGTACWLRPFPKCGWCSGRGCRRCKGLGRRIRVGRRVFNWLARRRREAQRSEVAK